MRSCFIALAVAVWLASPSARAQTADAEKYEVVEEHVTWVTSNDPAAYRRRNRPRFVSSVSWMKLVPPNGAWYGAPIIVTDVAAVALFHAGLAMGGDALRHGFFDTPGDEVMRAGAALYLAAGPTVHFANGRAFSGVASLAVRLTPVAGAAFGLFIGVLAELPDPRCWWYPGCPQDIPFALAVAGFEVFTVVASVTDIRFLARKPAPAPREKGLQVVPTFTMAKEGSHGRTPLLGIAGTF